MTVPDYVSEAAKRGLEWHKEGKSGDGVTDQTLREAREMADGTVTESKLRRMSPWFQRHKPDMSAPKNKPDNEDFPGAGAVAWALWGGPTSGDIMRTADWAEAKVKQLDAEAFDSSRIIMTIEEQLVKAASDLAGITTERDELRGNVEALVAKESETSIKLSADLEVANKKASDLEVAVSALSTEKAELLKQIAELSGKQISASAEAAKIAASVGVNPVELSPADKSSDAPAVAVNHLDVFLAMAPGAERSAYYAKHKNEIVRSV